MKNSKLLLAWCIAFFTAPVLADPKPESFYRDKWCSELNGETEFRLDDKTRVDCLTKHLAIEFDFAPKWAESIGQALHYARKTDKTPAIVLIVRTDYEMTHVEKLRQIIESNCLFVLLEIIDEREFPFAE
jgi:hypothetical protein